MIRVRISSGRRRARHMDERTRA